MRRNVKPMPSLATGKPAGRIETLLKTVTRELYFYQDHEPIIDRPSFPRFVRQKEKDWWGCLRVFVCFFAISLKPVHSAAKLAGHGGLLGCWRCPCHLILRSASDWCTLHVPRCYMQPLCYYGNHGMQVAEHICAQWTGRPATRSNFYQLMCR